MSYRKQLEVHIDGEATFSYYECSGGHDSCPVCNKWVGKTVLTLELRRKQCFPEKRAAIKGFWWWKKMCPLGGTHNHYSCKECNTVWICFHVKQPSNKVTV